MPRTRTTGDDAGTSRRGVLLGGAALLAGTAAATSLPAGAAVAVTAGHGEDAWPAGPGRPYRPQAPDADLRALLRRVDERRIEATVRKLASFGTRHTLSAQDDPRRGIGAARDWILAQMQRYAAASGGRMTVELQSYVQEPASRIPVATRITNVVATLRGSEGSARTYVVSGHYDSRATDVMDAESDAPGADDDASGVAAVMELARLMARTRPAATIVFAAVAGEEQGLYGANHLAEQLAASGADVQGMFTNDIIGASRADDGERDPRSVRLFAEGVPTAETPEQAAVRRSVGGENDSPPRQLARFVTSVAENGATGMQVRTIYRRDRYLRGGDHIPFLEQGWAAARFTEPHEDFAHQHQDVRVEDGVQYGDLPRFCDWGYIARVARVNGAALWSLAQGPGTPEGVQVLTAELTNDTELVWEVADDAAAYEVLWRPTDAPDWTHVVRVGRSGRARIDLSKDNASFGVRAVGRNGYRSPAVAPVPAR
ncbi:M20/M25/M40 family metallo-hydrolase [Vallicoccus soli]|uniref:M20/M25/M40 family metallo-hydrolase n=1 Tax=Vallicoccus soli TaxID=2339232 RepID=A0A3A3Z015_9ACTN|nr:M28 family metallopeptidase [Vallicoccus soli]RJK96421.1 M20/M25/M40 family metallo-hydrolase [Vallicoccus soli]